MIPKLTVELRVVTKIIDFSSYMCNDNFKDNCKMVKAKTFLTYLKTRPDRFKQKHIH